MGARASRGLRVSLTRRGGKRAKSKYRQSQTYIRGIINGAVQPYYLSMDPSIGTEQYPDVIVERVHRVEAGFAHPLGIHTLRSQAALDAQRLATATEPNVAWLRTYSTYYKHIVTYAGGVEFSCRYVNCDGRRLLCSVQFNVLRACRLVQLEIIAGNGQRSYYEDEVPIPNVAPIEFPEYA
ncbi:uncharacterized protein C8Q71DRAFT_725424 [Rhodofomes roseus]|uniref:Uncharacterized protein n=1 Tax=Rhodofomes roseus TaxID=34475 RepID=A0ABQ8KA70_9APHY|nr:uncharacterized protein C8Q71DRAFT_725424 [Rhodofomes roseus]KAH9834250.1 hypothetical protein C8Q71DRAFT_725424 [Rhodofomes roseus]